MVKNKAKTKAPKLSILLPFFNSEKTIKLTIDSILNQSFKDFELLCINDGSTDSSKQIVEEYIKKDSRVKIINKENSGYGASLNLAIKKAEGEYIQVVESDDFIHKDLCKTLLKYVEKPVEKYVDNHVEKATPNIVKCSFYSYFHKTGICNVEKIFHEVKFKDKNNPKDKGSNLAEANIKPKEMQNIFLVDPTIWTCLYEKEFLLKNKIKFLETPVASYQDTGFQFKTFACANSVYCIEKPFYYYCRDNESSSVKDNKKYTCVKEEFDAVDLFLKEKKMNDFLEIAAATRFKTYLWNYNRLKFTSAFKFAKLAKSDYRRIKKETSFRANYYIKNHISRAGESFISIKTPYLYIILRPLFNLYNLAKHKIYKLIAA